VKRQHRLLGLALVEKESHEQRRRDEREPQQLRRAPGERVPTPGDHQNERRDAGRQQRRTQPVDVAGSPHVRSGGQPDRYDQQGQKTDWRVDVEDPAPVEVLGDYSADQRTGDGGQGKRRLHVPLVAATLRRWDQVADDRLRVDHHSTRTGSLQRTEDNQLDHALGSPA
jgi:hypothetical protein